jgi:cell division protein FtsL
MTLTIPICLALVVWHSVQYADIEKDVARLEIEQKEWVKSNKSLIEGIAVLSASERIEYIAIYELGLSKVKPERVLQIRIQGSSNGIDG